MTEEGGVTMLNDDYYKQVCEYSMSMRMAKTMLKEGIISEEDYVKIDKIIADKYGINSCSIFRMSA